MKRKQKKLTFKCTLFPRPNRWLAGIQAIIGRLDPTEVQQPSVTDVGDLALELALKELEWLHRDKWVQELFYWPPDAPPCKDVRSLYLPCLEKYMIDARALCYQHFAYHHVLRIRCERWRRAHSSPRNRGWTKQPLKHADPSTPKRKRSFRLPKYDGFPDVVSPPPPSPPAVPLNRPGSRAKEILLCYDLLFGNRIVVRLCPKISAASA